MEDIIISSLQMNKKDCLTKCQNQDSTQDFVKWFFSFTQSLPEICYT